jgi:5-methylcytosine-specific restriction endonuclease McrA
MKICSKCHLLKSESEFYITDRKTLRRRADCISCNNAYKIRRYWEHKDENQVKHNASVLRSYYKYLEDNRAKSKRYHQEHKDELRAKSKTYYQEHITEIHAKQKKWREENPSKNLAYIKKWRDENPEKVKNAVKRWSLANPERVRINNQAYLARKKGAAIKDFTNHDWKTLLRIFNYHCAYCGRSQEEVKLTTDHIVPISRGGDHTVTNIVPACGSCNSKKKNKTLEEWNQVRGI